MTDDSVATVLIKVALSLVTLAATVAVFVWMVHFARVQFEEVGRMKHGVPDAPLTGRMVFRRLVCRHRDLARVKVRGFRETRCTRCGKRTDTGPELMQR